MRSKTIIGYEKYLKEIKKIQYFINIQCKSEKLQFNTVILLQKDEDLPFFGLCRITGEICWMDDQLAKAVQNRSDLLVPGSRTPPSSLWVVQPWFSHFGF